MFCFCLFAFVFLMYFVFVFTFTLTLRPRLEVSVPSVPLFCITSSGLSLYVCFNLYFLYFITSIAGNLPMLLLLYFFALLCLPCKFNSDLAFFQSFICFDQDHVSMHQWRFLPLLRQPRQSISISIVCTWAVFDGVLEVCQLGHRSLFYCSKPGCFKVKGLKTLSSISAVDWSFPFVGQR